MNFKIIGNPPYCRYRELSDTLREYLKDKFFCCNGTFDLYYAIIENCCRYSKDISIIVPNNFIVSLSGRNLRHFLSAYETRVYDLKHLRLFQDADTPNCILHIKNSDNPKVTVNDKQIINPKSNIWVEKPVKSEYNFTLHNGIQTSANTVFIFRDKKDGLYYSKSLKKYVPIEEEYIKPSIKGSTLEETYCLYPYDDKGNPIEPDHNSDCWKYLLENRKILEQRDFDDKWYNFGRTQGINLMNSEKCVLSSLLSPNKEIRYKKTSAIVYSGLFVVNNFSEFEKFTKDKQVIEFLYNNGKKKAGNWTEFSIELVNQILK